MSEKTQRIIEIQKQLKSLDLESKRSCASLGRDLYEKNRKNDSEKFGSVIGELNRLDEEKNKAEKSISDIETLLSAEKKLEDEFKQLENQIHYLERDNAGHFENIGKAAYSAYKASLLRGDEFDEVFIHIAGVDDKIEHFEDRIKSAGGRKNGILKKIGDGVSRFVFTTRKTIAKGSTGRLFQKAGKELVEKKIIENVATKEVALAARPYYENMETINSMQEELSGLDKEKAKTAELLKSRCEGIRPSVKIEAFRNKISAFRAAAEEQYVLLGETAVSAKGGNLAFSTEVGELFSSIPELGKTVKKLKAEQSRLNTEIRIDQLSEEKEKEEFTVSVQKEKINDAEERIQKAEQRIAELNQEIGKLQK